MKHHRNLNHQKRTRFLRRFRFIIIALIVIVIVAVAYLLGIYRADTTRDAISKPTTEYIAPSIQTFETPYFQFQANKHWAQDTAASKEGVYVYRSFKSGLLEQRFTIYVNQSTQEVPVTRVMEVTLKGKSGVVPEKLSEHCGKASGFNDSRKTVTLDRVTFTCFGDDTRFNVMAGLIDGTTTIDLARADGSMAKYSLYYANLTTMPDAAQFQEILNTFQTR